MNNSNAEQFHNEYNTDEKNIQQLDPFECMLIDVAQKGLKSEYWEKVIPYQWHGNPTSSVNQMYVAGLVYGFHDSEIMRLIGEKAQELQIVFEKTSFWYWLEFFAERHEKRDLKLSRKTKRKQMFFGMGYTPSIGKSLHMDYHGKANHLKPNFTLLPKSMASIKARFWLI